MPVIRPTALRALQSTLRHSSARATARSAPCRTQLVVRRYASSGGHGGGHGEASSDLPWMLGALAITPPACWYLWPEPHAEHHGGHGEHDDHAEAEGGEEEESQEASAPAEKTDEPEKDAETEDKPEKKSEDDSDGEDKASGSEGEEQSDDSEKKDKQAPTEKQEGGSDQSTQGKGKMKEDSDGHNETRKSEPAPPSRGTRIKRIDSGLGKNLGEGSTYRDDDPEKESQATSKEAGSSPGDMSQKQKGLSTTDTRHSVQIDERDDKSKKGTGEPETAKAKGTVDPSAPVRGGPSGN